MSEVLSDLLLFVISDRRALKSACFKLYTTLNIFRLLHPERLNLNILNTLKVLNRLCHTRWDIRRSRPLDMVQ